MASLEELARAFAQVEEEIRALQGRYSGLESSSQDAFASVRQRIEGIEEDMRDRGRGHGEDGGKGGRSLIHPKMLNPAVLSQSDHWRKWKGDVEEYCEHIHRGMKDIMDQATKADGEIEEQWFHNTEDCWWDRSEVLWSFLRRFTDGEARRVVLSVSNCNGWNASSRALPRPRVAEFFMICTHCRGLSPLKRGSASSKMVLARGQLGHMT